MTPREPPGEAPPFQFLLTRDAELDLEELHAWLVDTVSPQAADRLLAEVSATIDRLARFPHRGSLPPELADVGIRDYRQVQVKPWRLVYLVRDARVIIVMMADTRRDLSSLLMARLLRA